MRHIIVIAIAITVLTLATSACSTKEDSMPKEQRINEVAAAARADIDALAAQIGTDPEVSQDVITDCIPGNSNSGKSLIYTVRLTIEDPKSALDRLRGPISDELAAEGWSVKPNPSGNSSTGEGMHFRKGTTTMIASIFTENRWASVGGSGGCVDK